MMPTPDMAEQYFFSDAIINNRNSVLMIFLLASITDEFWCNQQGEWLGKTLSSIDVEGRVMVLSVEVQVRIHFEPLGGL